MSQAFDDILSALPRFRDLAEAGRETLLANLVMLGEIPAPTFKEEQRIQLLLQRFSECGLQNASTDEMGNGLGILPGYEGEQNILIVAHADTPFPAEVDHTITVQADHVTGAGLADNSLGVTILASLPTFLERMGIRLKSNLILMGACRSLGRGNQEGLRFFLDNRQVPVTAGICVEGVQLGRLSFASVGMARGDISCTVPETHDWTRFGTVSAIITLNEVINKILQIPLPRRPATSIVLGTVQGGDSHGTIPAHAVLGFEVRSEAPGRVRGICRRLEGIVAEHASHHGADVSLDIFARRAPGGLNFTHPLVRRAGRILEALEVRPAQGPSLSELSEFVNRDIPAITVGLTSGESVNKPNEALDIKPMFTGVAQLIGILLAIDGGLCDEN